MKVQLEQLYGTWRLVSMTQEVIGTGERSEIFGKAPHGSLTYGREGRMSAILVSENRPKPMDSAKLTQQEQVALFKSMVAYAGTFTVEGSRVVHTVDISWNENMTGTTQVRNFCIDGYTLTLHTDPGVSPINGKQTSTVFIWEKVQ